MIKYTLGTQQFTAPMENIFLAITLLIDARKFGSRLQPMIFSNSKLSTGANYFHSLKIKL